MEILIERGPGDVLKHDAQKSVSRVRIDDSVAGAADDVGYARGDGFGADWQRQLLNGCEAVEGVGETPLVSQEITDRHVSSADRRNGVALKGPETHDLDNFTPATASLAQFEGVYRSARRPHDTSESLLNPGSFIRVEMTNDALLTIDNVEGYRQISENVFWKPGLAPFVESAGSAPLYAFLTDEAGRVTGVTPQISTDVFERVHVGISTIARLGGASWLVVLSGLAGAFWSVRSARQRWARRLAVALAATSAAIPITAIVGMALTGNLLLAVAVMDVSLFIALAMVSNLAAALCIALIATLALCWKDQVARRTPGSAANLIHWSLVALSGVGLLGALNYFSLVGLHLP